MSPQSGEPAARSLRRPQRSTRAAPPSKFQGPQKVEGIGDDGFKEGSWVGMKRPFLIGTGLGDGGTDFGPRRRDGYYGSSAENQYMLYFNHIGAQHGLFGQGGAEACKKEVSEAEHELCDTFESGLQSTVAAFLASILLDDKAARNWLRSQQIESLVPSAEWDYR